jgi:uncharacterized protein (DUF2267 family)
MTVTMRFDAVLETASDWIEAVMTELKTPQKRSGFAALRAMLHALRDSLELERAVQLGDGLPTLIRGLYYEGWAAGKGTSHILQPAEFLDVVRHALHGHAELPDPLTSVQATFVAVGKLLPQHELDAVMRSLPADIRRLCQPKGASA